MYRRLLACATALVACAAVVTPADVAAARPKKDRTTTTTTRPTTTTTSQPTTTTTAPTQPTTTTTTTPSSVYAPPSTVRADCSVAVDAGLQAFLDGVPDGSTIEFPAGACYGLNTGLVLRNRHNLSVQGNGAVFRFLIDPNSISRLNHRNWTVASGSNVSFHNMVAEGWRPDPINDTGFYYSKRGTPSQQQQAGFFIASLQGGNFVDLTARNTMGDNIFVGPDMEGLYGDFCRAVTPKDVLIDNFTGYNGGRTNVAITVGENIVVQNSTFEYGYDQGIDVETDAGDCQPSRDILLANNRWGISQNGTLVYTGGEGPPAAARMEVSGNRNRTPITCVDPWWHYPGNGAVVYPGADRSQYVHDNHLAALGHGARLIDGTGRVENNTFAANYGYGCMSGSYKAMVRLAQSSGVNVAGNVQDPASTGVGFTHEWFDEGGSTGITSNAPAAPTVDGATYGPSSAASGQTVTARATGAVPGTAYRLVLGDADCDVVKAVLRVARAVAGADGSIAATTGRIPSNLESGSYHLCFRALVDGGPTVRTTAPIAFSVT